MWIERDQINSHQAVIDVFRDRLPRHNVHAKSRTEDGRGTIVVEKNGDATAIPYHLPEFFDRLVRVIRDFEK